MPAQPVRPTCPPNLSAQPVRLILFAQLCPTTYQPAIGNVHSPYETSEHLRPDEIRQPALRCAQLLPASCAR
ncbi:MAG: hypothetical protein AAF152_21080, partial [Cyanobacteria bacterium P01_A01_bin.114]